MSTAVRLKPFTIELCRREFRSLQEVLLETILLEAIIDSPSEKV